MNPIFRYTTSLLALGVAGLFCGCASIQGPATAEGSEAGSIDRSQRPPAGPLPEASFPSYDTVILDNGLTIYLIESDRQPTITYRMMIRSGGLFDGDLPGLSELVADLLSKGVEGKTAYDIASEIDFIGGSISAESSSDFTTLTVSGLSKYGDQLLGMLSELARSPTFPEEELGKMKQRYLSSLQSERQNPGSMADALRRKLVYGDNGYGARKSEETIGSVTRDDLAAFHAAHFVPNNASLAIVGDFDPGELLAAIDGRFADWARQDPPQLPELEFPEIGRTSVHILDRPDSVQSAIRVAQQSVSRAHPDALPLRLLMSVLGGGSSGRMFQNLREDKGFTYGAFAYAANAARFGSIVTAVEVRNEVTADAVREILLELRRIQSEPIPQAELERHRKYLAGTFVTSLENALTTATRVLEIDIYGLDPDFYSEYVQRLAAVGPGDLERIADRRIESDEVVVGIVGNASAIADSLSQFGPVTIYNDRLEVVEGP